MKILSLTLILTISLSCGHKKIRINSSSYEAIINTLTYDDERIQHVIQDYYNLHHEYDRGDKYKFAEIIEVFEKIAISLEQYASLRSINMSTLDSLQSLGNQLNSNFEEVKSDLINGILSNYDSYGRNESEALTLCDEIGDLKLESIGLESSYLNFIILESEYFNNLDKFKTKCLDIAGTIYDEYWAFPVVSSSNCNYAVGDIIEFNISLGSYSSSYDPNDVIIQVDGDTLKINEQGYATYISTAKKIGINRKELTFEVINRQNGEVSGGESVYSYTVY